MDQTLTIKRDKGINGDKSAFIPFSKPAGVGGINGINPYRVYPVSPSRFAGAL